MPKTKTQGGVARTKNGSAHSGDRMKKKNDKNNNAQEKNAVSSNKNTKSKGENSKEKDMDWIASLVKENASRDDGAGANTIPSKEDRKRKREMKKNRRMEQQQQKQQQRQQNQRQQVPVPSYTVEKSSKTKTSQRTSALHSAQQEARSAMLLKVSKHRIRRLCRTLKVVQKSVSGEKGPSKVRFSPYYDLPKGSNPKAPRTSNGVPTKKRKRQKWSEDSIQPLRSDYSGIGMARESMYIEFIDPSYFPKLEEEFQEHIPGFFGKQRTKAMKRQMDGNMLWRRLANEKKKNAGSKKFKEMSTDERLQAMLDSTDRSDLLGQN